MTSDMSAESSKGTGLTAWSSTPTAEKSPCRAAPPTLRSRHITSNDPSSSCWSGSQRSRRSTALRIAGAIEHTRFPFSSAPEDHAIDEWAALLRAADLIGQLGDPHYLRKTNALFYEFEEIGLNRQLGYESPADLVDKYPQFYWDNVSPYIQNAIRYLNVTSSGRQWINGLYSNVFRAEHELRLFGPQP